MASGQACGGQSGALGRLGTGGSGGVSFGESEEGLGVGLSLYHFDNDVGLRPRKGKFVVKSVNRFECKRLQCDEKSKQPLLIEVM